MTDIFIVVAFGGMYEDSWERNIRACRTEADAQALIDNYVRWLEEIRAIEFPESLQEYNFDLTDEEEQLRYDISLNEFKDQVLIDMGVPEIDRDWLLENWDYSYCCDSPAYNISTVVLQ